MTYRSAVAAVVASWSLGIATAGPPAAQASSPSADRRPVHVSAAGLEAFHYAPRVHGDGTTTGGAVELGFSGGAGDQVVRLGTTWAGEEHRLDLAVVIDTLTVNLFTGSGESYGRLDPDALQADPFFFHGGSRDAFDYRGAAAELAIGRAVSLQFAFADIASRDLDDRRTAYAGFSAGRATAGAFSVTRKDDVTAGGLMLSWSGGTGVVDFRQVEHESGARYRSVGFARTTAGGHRFGVSVRDGSNPLYREADESRIMFHLAGTLGASPPDNLAASDTVDNGGGEPSGEKETPSGKARGLAVLGGALVAVGVASSSGSDERDSAIRIRGRDNAARQVLNFINPVSVRQNREHGGWIYRNADGTFGYTDPVKGTVASVDIGPKSVVPGGTVANASYHTHGGPDPRYDSENFSPSDLLSDRLQQTDGYLGTPAGYMKLHHFRTGDITVLGRINN